MRKPKIKPIIKDSTKTEFENFEDFAKKLFRVPKSEQLKKKSCFCLTSIELLSVAFAFALLK